MRKMLSCKSKPADTYQQNRMVVTYTKTDIGTEYSVRNAKKQRNILSAAELERIRISLIPRGLVLYPFGEVVSMAEHQANLQFRKQH